ncbi:MAG: leucyl aminopeptidase family protein [Candidatus Aminicenantes bacterium]|jgi:leucyl aminopeptidase
MKILRGQKLNLKDIEAIIVPTFTDPDAEPIIHHYPEAEFFIRRQGFKGKAGEEIILNSADKKKSIVIVGVGQPDCLADTITCAKKVISVLRANKIKRAVIHFWQDLEKLGVGQVFWVNFIDFLFINHYSFDDYKTNNNKSEKIDRISVFFDKPNPSNLLSPSFFKEREIINQSVKQVRDLVNETPARMNPDYMAAEFEGTAKECDLDILILREKELQEYGFNGILSVGKASPYESALIRLSYIPEESVKSIALVGKGITFDSGGLSLKSRSGMTGMKSDMSGAAAVLGIIAAVSKLKLPVIVDVFAPVAENMPGQYAYKPGDIITFNNKKTVEIVDTDAEGRLLLADALIMAAEDNPDFIIELSTLTGSVANFLGDGVAGLMGNNETLVSMLLDSGLHTGERLWQLPLIENYQESIKSKLADLKNAGYGRASAIKTGLFLSEFTKKIPFAHIDIAGTAFLSRSNTFYTQEGATGFGVRLVLDFLQNLKKNKKII